MADVNNPAVTRVTIEGRLDQQLVENVMHFVADDSVWSQEDMGTLVDQVADWIAAELAPLLSEQMIWLQVRAVNLSDGPRLQAIKILNPAIGGQVTGECMPGSVAACVSLQTGYAGRAAQGRQYVPGIPETAVNFNTFLSNFSSDLVTAYQTLLVSLVTAPYKLCVYSTEENKLPRAVGLATVVTGAAMRDGTVDNQRRRLPGRGR